ncbi:MAG: hypothetical protein ACRYGR_00665 [Janthinobacterium lividum]
MEAAFVSKSVIPDGGGGLPDFPQLREARDVLQEGEASQPVSRLSAKKAALAAEGVERLRTIHATLRDRVAQASDRQAANYNRHHRDMQFEEKEQVLLNAKNIKVKRPCRKLGAKYLSPYTIEKKVSADAYKLTSPPSLKRLHPTFHVSLLESYRQRPGSAAAQATEVLEDDRYENEAIVDYDKETDTYEAKWVGYSEDDNTMEPLEDLNDCDELLQQFWARQRSKDAVQRNLRSKVVEPISESITHEAMPPIVTPAPKKRDRPPNTNSGRATKRSRP